MQRRLIKANSESSITYDARHSLTDLVPPEVLLHVPESAKYPDVEQEERHEGHDPRRQRPDPVGVHDDVRRVEPQAEIQMGNKESETDRTQSQNALACNTSLVAVGAQTTRTQ